MPRSRPVIATLIVVALMQAAPIGVRMAEAQVPAPAPKPAVTAAPDSPVDSIRPARRIAVSQGALATAFKDPAARALLLRARAARLSVDSALLSYSAKSYRRATVKLGFREVGLEKTVYRQESSGLVQWGRSTGAKVTLTGQREDSPLAPGRVRATASVPFPYFPGSETLWIGGAAIARDEVDEARVVHPIARGSEAYYTYAIGDSVRMSLPGGQLLTLRELRVTPRAPTYNVLVGSFWFDEGSAQLVRATYRLAAEADLTSRARNAINDGRAQVPFLVRQLAFPLRAELSLISIESSLYEGRFWLPRSHVASGIVRLNLGTLPVMLEERFSYESVNGDAPVVPAGAAPVGIRWDTLTRVAPKERRAVAQAWVKAEDERRKRECAAGPTWHMMQERYGGRVPTYIEVPCDTAALARSSDLPEKMYDATEERAAALDASARGLDLGRQAAFRPQLPTWTAGFADGMLRYNRVEGLSLGARIRQELGAGYVFDGMARVGSGDRWVNGEIGLARTNGTETWRVAAYAKTVAEGDWGTPFGFPESMMSALFARDEGFYARTWGGELTRTVGGDLLRVFVEGQGNAAVTTRWSARYFGDDPAFLSNVRALEGTWAGAQIRQRWARGVDVTTGRWTLETNLEGAGGTTSYGRLMADALGATSLGGVGGTLVLAAGGAAGTLPAQRAFMLGGARTVRGQVAGTMMGDAFWLVRAEVGPTWPIARPVVFYDAGWAGPRTTSPIAMRPMSGAGVGVTALDGLVRLDVARGIWPSTAVRVDFSWAARF
ncbi:MAG: hypothetical protein HY275_05400 [Gemmatimonadetes bacterium]|nr:hypothetical protein [Gemmatimonadota bacterium]